MNNENTYLTPTDALSTITNLARSQGMYGRLLANLYDNPGTIEAFEDWVSESKFRDSLDLILALEG